MKNIILSDEQVLEIIQLCKTIGIAPSRIMEHMIETLKEKFKEEL